MFIVEFSSVGGSAKKVELRLENIVPHEQVVPAASSRGSAGKFKPELENVIYLKKNRLLRKNEIWMKLSQYIRK